ncbi:MAG: AAA family ATPase, partial [Clostridia bacterium]|nr:AAA family ATPase [Clostridia bacterium]
MDDNRRLALIRKRLAEILEEARSSSADHMEAMRAITADAWEDLRLRPTEVSVEEMQQLAAEIDRYAARRKFLEDDASAAIKMLKAPFFGRVDFEEKNCAPTSYYIGMHGLSDDKGGLLVCDWRAPVSELYYSKALGQTAYKSPMGMIEGTLTGKRQYHFEDGVLKYSVDTDVNIDDQMLLDILSESKSGPMKQIVATIQGEQDAAIRCDTERVLSVIGGAGSGKTGVALHRAAYLLYNHRESMTAEAMCILSPGTAFSEYISEVLPSLGERNIPAVTVHTIVEDVLKRKVESPSMRLNLLLERPTDERLSAVTEKDSAAFADRIEVFARNLVNRGYDFEDIC